MPIKLDTPISDLMTLISPPEGQQVKKENIIPNTIVVTFWFKPNWNIKDPWTRPHSILDCNEDVEDALFQLFSDSKALNSKISKARWSVLTWLGDEDFGFDDIDEITLYDSSAKERYRITPTKIAVKNRQEQQLKA